MVSFWVLWVCQAFMVSFALASNAYGIHKCYVKCTHCLVFIKYYEGRGNHLYHPSGQETVCSGSRKTLFEPMQKRLSEVSMPFTMCFTRQIQRSKLVPIQKEVNTIRIYHCIKEGEKQPEKVHNVVSAAGVVGILEHNKFLANWNFPRLRRKKRKNMVALFVDFSSTNLGRMKLQQLKRISATKHLPKFWIARLDNQMISNVFRIFCSCFTGVGTLRYWPGWDMLHQRSVRVYDLVGTCFVGG